MGLMIKLVPKRGLEPLQDFSHSHLKAACLPFHHLGVSFTIPDLQVVSTLIFAGFQVFFLIRQF